MFFVCIFHYRIQENGYINLLFVEQKVLILSSYECVREPQTTLNEWQKEKKTFHFISIPCTLLLFGRYIELADMSFIFVFNTVEEAFTDDWIFRYFLSLDFLLFT